jgi:hypothetical protein
MNLEEFSQVVNVLAAAVEEGRVKINEILGSYDLMGRTNILEGLDFIPRGEENE